MSAPTVPETRLQPAGTPPDRKVLGPALVARPTLPLPVSDEPEDDWPKDVHLPDEEEDVEC